MRILHVVTLHSSDNAFGGPVRVALNLANELTSQKNSVVLLAGSRGLYHTDTVEGVSAKLFPVQTIHPKLGFSGIFSWRLWIWAWRNVKSFDVVHLHLARDLVTLPVGLIAMLRKVPFVIQGHGMIDPTNKLLGRILDRLFTRKLLLRAESILYLTPTEENDIKEVSRNHNAKMSFLPNGVPLGGMEYDHKARYVSFISRLQDRKHPEIFVQMAAILNTRGSEYEFRIAGADEGRLAQTLEAIRVTNLGAQIEYLGSLEHEGVLELLSQTKILVLPSVNEPFPMIILEALSQSVPVVITGSCGLAPYITKGKAGIVTDRSPENIAEAVQTIMADIQTFSENAQRLSRSDFSMTQIVEQLNQHYELATHGKRNTTVTSE